MWMEAIPIRRNATGIVVLLQRFAARSRRARHERHNARGHGNGVALRIIDRKTGEMLPIGKLLNGFLTECAERRAEGHALHRFRDFPPEVLRAVPGPCACPRSARKPGNTKCKGDKGYADNQRDDESGAEQSHRHFLKTGKTTNTGTGEVAISTASRNRLAIFLCAATNRVETRHKTKGNLSCSQRIQGMETGCLAAFRTELR